MTIYQLPRPLDAIEQRVLGCLLEKELATPDAYPLSLKSLTSAANQKSNREPVVSLSEGEVDGALMRLLPEVLVWRVRSSRVPRWQHNLESKWTLGTEGRAVMAELLLRGPQTPGELRTRGSRMAELPDLESVHTILDQLAALGLVEELGRQPGQKESRWTHRLGEPPDEEATRALPVGHPAAASSGRTSAAPRASQLDELEARLGRLEVAVLEMQRALGLDSEAVAVGDEEDG